MKPNFLAHVSSRKLISHILILTLLNLRNIIQNCTEGKMYSCEDRILKSVYSYVVVK